MVRASGGQVVAAVVVAGHPDTPVVDHDHVDALGRRVPAQPAIKRHRRHARPAGNDDQRIRRLPPGPDVVEVELLVAVRRQWSPHWTHAWQRGQLVVRTATLGVHGHRRPFCSWR